MTPRCSFAAGHRSLEHGSILIVALGAIMTVGAVAAGTTALLQQNSVTSNEETRAIQGRSVADTLRLFVEREGGLTSGLQFAIEDNLYTEDTELQFTAGAISSLIGGKTRYRGFIEANGQSWGNEFREKEGGSGVDVPFTAFPDGDSNALPDVLEEACKQYPTCEFGKKTGKNATIDEAIEFKNSPTFELNANTDLIFNAPVYFSKDAFFELKNKATITFNSLLLVDGDLTAYRDAGTGKSRTISAEETIIRGNLDLSSEFEMTSDPFDCSPSSSINLTGNTRNTAVFRKLAVGKQIQNAVGNSTGEYTADLDCTVTSDATSRELDLSGGGYWYFFN